MVVTGLDKEIYFRKKDKSKCYKCKKEITSKSSIVGYNHLFCKECYKKFDKESKKEVDRVFKDFLD